MPAAKRASADAHVHVRVVDYASGPCRLRERAPTWCIPHGAAKPAVLAWKRVLKLASTPTAPFDAAVVTAACRALCLTETCFPPPSRRTKGHQRPGVPQPSLTATFRSCPTLVPTVAPCIYCLCPASAPEPPDHGAASRQSTHTGVHLVM